MNVLQIKAAVRERDGYKCTECGMTNFEHVLLVGRSLEVHRLAPGSVYSIEGCVTLCQPCHSSKPKSEPFSRYSPKKNAFWFPVSIDARLKNLVDEYAAQNDPQFTVRAVVESALKAFFRSKGKWPDADDAK